MLKKFATDEAVILLFDVITILLSSDNSIFDSVSFLLQFIFLFYRKDGHFHLTSKLLSKATYTFASRPLISMLQKR